MNTTSVKASDLKVGDKVVYYQTRDHKYFGEVIDTWDENVPSGVIRRWSFIRTDMIGAGRQYDYSDATLHVQILPR